MVIGDESNLLSVDAENELLRDDHTSKETIATTPYQPDVYNDANNYVKKSLGVMADSLLAVKQSLKQLHSSQTGDNDGPNPKKRKHGTKNDRSNSEKENDDSDVEMQALCETDHEETPPTKPCA